MIQKICKNNDKKLDIFMSLMQKIPQFLELKWIKYEFWKMSEILDEAWTKDMEGRSNMVDRVAYW